MSRTAPVPASSSLQNHSPRRVLFVMDVFGGGTGNHVLGMLRRWDRSKWEPGLVCVSQIGPWMDTAGIATRVLPPGRWWEPFPISHLRRFFILWRHVRRGRYTLVHAYFFWSILFARLLKLLGVIHHLVENREDMGFNWGRFEYTCLRLTRRMPNMVICVCEAVRRVALQKESLDKVKTAVIRNGIEPGDPPRREVALRDELGIPRQAPTVGMVANFNRPVKGVSDFLDAIPLIIRQIPEAHFLLVGSGSEEANLRAKAANLAITDRLHFAGFREDVHRYYQTMDVSVLTSHSEGLSITVLESMRYGLPVVATRVGGNPEVIQDGVTGFLVPPKDAVAFADKAVEIFRDPDLRHRMGAAARRSVEAEFPLQDVTCRYLEVYESLDS